MTDRHRPYCDPWRDTIDMLNPDDWQLEHLTAEQRAYLLTQDYHIGRSAALCYGIVFPRLSTDGVIMLIFNYPMLATMLADEIIYGKD